VGGTGPIRDLKFEKGDSASQSPLAGYHLIPADLNKGAQGTYIYLTFTRDSTSVQTGTQCGWETGEFVTGLLVHDYNWFDVAGFKGVCVGIGAPWTPIWEDTHNPLSPWKHPDLNDGSGGRFILAWQAKVDGSTPVTEVGVVSGSSSAIRCPSGWIKDSNDLGG
jgi:hypothetical protein